LYTNLERGGLCFEGFHTLSSFAKPWLAWRLLPWPTDIADPAIGGIGSNNAGARMVSGHFLSGFPSTPASDR
jgi:hypothetical protein